MITLSKGIRRNPATASDGELDYAMNLMPKDGELRTVPQPENLGINLSEGDVALCVHNVQQGKHIIVKNTNTLAYYDSQGERHVINVCRQEPDKVTVMGNVLIVRYPNAGGYAVWKDSEYVCLEGALPQMQMQFQLRNHFVQNLDKGEDTGITLERTSSTTTADFSQTVPPTPMTVTFSGRHEFYIDVTLLNDTAYRLHLRSLEGRPKIGLSVWTVDSNNEEHYCGYAYDRSPYVTFNTGTQNTVTRLKCVVYSSNKQNFRYSAVLLVGNGMTTEFVMANTEENYNAVMAVANKFVNRHSRRDNKFIYPFFVRYALRMYDGSLICPSSPCLMLPNEGRAPQMWTIQPADAGRCDTYTSANVAELMYKIVDTSQMRQWKDLVIGVAIAVSPPVYSFDQGAEWTEKRNMLELKLKTWDDNDDDTIAYGAFDEGNGAFSANWMFRNCNSVGNDQNVYGILLPQIDEKQMQDNLKTTTEFFIVKELMLDELPQTSEWNTLDMEEHTLEGLEGRSRLDDNVLSLSQRWGKMMMVYNSRLVAGNITESKFKGYMPALMNGYCGNMRDGVTTESPVVWEKAVVHCVENGEKQVLCVMDHDVYNNAPMCWFAYPDVDAKKAVLWRRFMDGRYQRAEMTLTPHRLLNLSFWFDAFNQPQWVEMGMENDITGEELTELQTAEQSAETVSANKLQQSAVNNPFLFEPALTNRVGDNNILTMATTTKALSQGQFGDFPLYVFTTDGIWALTVGDDGSFVTKQPVSRDVCMDAEAVVMTDNAVVFATKKGLMKLTGASLINLSGQMEGAVPDLSVINGIAPSFDSLVVDETMDFNALVARSKMAYDYHSNLLHIYPDCLDAHYICSLDNGEFVLTDHTPRPMAVVNDYPDTLIQTSDGLYRLTGRNADARTRGLVLTRPFCFNDVKALKRMRDLRIIWKRLSAESSVRVAVLASNDRHKWWRMRSLNSHSYRWFRIAVFADITDYESIGFIVLDRLSQFQSIPANPSTLH